MALRDVDWVRVWSLSEMYATCDPHGWDATGGLQRTLPRRYPAEWSEWISTRFGDFDIGWTGMAYAVDQQAPGPIQPRTRKWIKAGARDLIKPGFAAWAKNQIQRELGKRPPFRRTLARLIEAAGGGTDDEQLDELESWEKQQDAASFLRWADRLPITRNVLVGLTTRRTRDVLHVAAGQADDLDLGRTKLLGSMAEALAHIEEWHFNEMLIDVDWLRSVYRLSPQQSEMFSLHLQGFRQEAIAITYGVGVSSANEQLDRARKRIRDLWGLSPSNAPLHVRRQPPFENTRTRR